MATTNELLAKALVRIFGAKTVRVAWFEGRGRRKLRIPAAYFARDCLKDRALKPINKKASDRMVELVKRALAGKSDYDVCDVSKYMRDYLYDFFGVETADLVIEGEEDPDRDIKAAAQLCLFRHVMAAGIGVEEIDDAAMAAELERVAGDRREAPGWSDAASGLAYGVERFCYRTGDVGYPELIDHVADHMDVLHFRGLTWTNSQSEFLMDCLARAGVEVRVGLCDPGSPFFGAFAAYIGEDAGELSKKTGEVIRAWQLLHARAAKMAAKQGPAPAHLRLYLTRDFPAKAIYRFDDRAVVCLVKPDFRFGTAVGILDQNHPMLLGPNPFDTA